MSELFQSTDAAPAAAGVYRVLARKYRPQDFSALIGQEPMVRTLTNAFAAGRIAQAWLLTGVRGVGKTTTARILARALNYRSATVDRPTVDLSEPGENCKAIMEGRHVDVIEMDAASHTGIDNMRELLEQVRYAPQAARYKVYIIDEVHMLSGASFNAMLKTLEEPPPHVKFIFATTEIRKVPITVLSRCQRFDLRRVEAGVLAAHLTEIAGREGVEAEPEAIAMIARAAEGSVRDSLSILDQAIVHGSGKVAASAVRDMMGLADRARVVDLFRSVMAGDVAAALAEFRSQYDAGADPTTVLTDLAEFTHLVTRLKYVPSAANDATLSEAERGQGAEFAATLPVRALARAWQMLLKGITEVSSATRPAAAAEMVLIRLAHAASLPTLDEALKALADGAPAPSPGAIAGGGAVRSQPVHSAPQATIPPRMSVSTSGGQTMRLVEQSPEPADRQIAAPVELPAVAVNSLVDIAALADKHRDVTFKILLKRHVRPVRIRPGQIEVALAHEAPRTLLNDLSSRLKEWTGRNWVAVASREEGGPTLAEEEERRRDNAVADARSDPAVAAILAKFPGAKIIDVRLPQAAEAPEIDMDMPADPGLDAPGDDDN
ncbi:MAG: DNA polymerase III subunit gamma/tau [Rhizobiaceae bacterium]|nr:DNA polymerase III subunit gamma/tau [Rhizobiaceae bacterium]